MTKMAELKTFLSGRFLEVSEDSFLQNFPLNEENDLPEANEYIT